jgi:uncharacterized membrane protein YagU involved in acid resistance
MSAHDLGIHLPPPSMLPIMLAFAMALFFGGFIVHWGISIVAAVMVVLIALYVRVRAGALRGH